MKQIILPILIGLLLILILIPNSANAQIQVPFTNDQQFSVESLKLNPFIDPDESVTQMRELWWEFFAFEIGYVGGALCTSVLAYASYASMWTGSPWFIPLAMSTVASALETHLLAGYLLHRVGSRYHTDRKLSTAIIASLLGTVIASGSNLLLHYADFFGGDDEMLAIANWLIIPNLTAVIFYNTLARSGKKSSGMALMNSINGNLSPGIPTLSISPNPFIPGTYNTQLRLLSIKF
ncbi:MAG: hypothetical protein U9N86_05645 [Bacteroidota bacterium]|nr:hypothetical protein [Bacteroidota bacterium]